LRELIHDKDLPKAYGGELAWVFEDEPSLDEDTVSAIHEMPKGPVIYKDGAVAKPE
jgi:hypothetical protein